MITRRFVLGSAIALPFAAKALASGKKQDVPVLYGDGQHDDTVALQAFFDHKPVVWPDGSLVGCELRGRRFRVSRPVDLRVWGLTASRCPKWHALTDNHFDYKPMFRGPRT